MRFHQRIVLCLPVVILSVGCGGSVDAPKTVPVVGKITYGGGAWPKPVSVSFAVEEAEPGFPMNSGTADLQPDGTFKASTFDEGDGLVPGRYAINLNPRPADPGAATAADNPIPQKYRSGATSGLKVTVPKDSKQPVKVELDVPTT